MKDKLKIAIITPDYPPDIIGGAGISSEMLARNLRERGIETDVFAFHSKINKTHSIKVNDNSTDFYIKTSRNLFLLQIKIIFVLFWKLRKYSIIHAYNVTPLPGLSFINLFKIKKLQIIATLNNHNLSCANTGFALSTSCQVCSVKRSLNCYKLKSNNHFKAILKNIAFIFSKKITSKKIVFIALTENMRDRYQIAGFKKNRYTIIPNAVDNKFLQKLSSIAYFNDNSKLILLYVGQLNFRKGALDLVKAFELLDDALKERVKLKIIGNGPEEIAIKKHIEEKNIDITINQVDYDDLVHEYLDADIFIHPAKWLEPFSRTWLEAIASGLPIISSDNPSAMSILGNGAVYFKNHDIQDLKDKLELLINDNTLRKDLSMINKQKIKLFTEEKVYSMIIDEYNKIVKG